MKKISILLASLALASTLSAAVPPPYGGTIFIDPDIITSADATRFTATTDNGRGTRTVFDRRADAFISINAYLFRATYSDYSAPVEVRVNPEFGSTAAARTAANKFARVIGRLPKCVRQDLRTITIHKGNNPFGGGNFDLLIHTGKSAEYEADGILEETLVHEASHVSLDSRHRNTTGWLAAQQSDPTFISTYARDNPTSEDVAESFLTYLAIRYRNERISATNSNKIKAAIPARIAYFDSKNLDVTPVR